MLFPGFGLDPGPALVVDGGDDVLPRLFREGASKRQAALPEARTDRNSANSADTWTAR
jgi:hypothetical protein